MLCMEYVYPVHVHVTIIWSYIITPRRACAQRGKVIGCVCRYIYMYVCAMQNDKNTDLSKNTALKAMKRGI